MPNNEQKLLISIYNKLEQLNQRTPTISEVWEEYQRIYGKQTK